MSISFLGCSKQYGEPPLLSAVTECQSAGGLAKVPDGNLPSCQLPEDRRRKFTEHLRTTLERALLIIADPSASRSALIDYAHRDQESEKAPVLPVINGCTTCRGFCCRSGGETAFLTPGHFAWQMLSDPTLTTEAMERWYLNQLPEISMENSCVYHSERGCSIPRRQRASICNDFHCWGLQGVLAEHQDGDQVDWVAFAASETEAKRVSIMLSNGERTERDMLLRLDDSNE